VSTGPAGAIAPEQAAQSPRVSPCPGVILERPGAASLAAPPGVDAAGGFCHHRPMAQGVHPAVTRAPAMAMACPRPGCPPVRGWQGSGQAAVFERRTFRCDASSAPSGATRSLPSPPQRALDLVFHASSLHGTFLCSLLRHPLPGAAHLPGWHQGLWS